MFPRCGFMAASRRNVWLGGCLCAHPTLSLTLGATLSAAATCVASRPTGAGDCSADSDDDAADDGYGDATVSRLSGPIQPRLYETGDVPLEVEKLLVKHLQGQQLRHRGEPVANADVLKYVLVAFKFRVPNSEENRSYTEFSVPRNGYIPGLEQAIPNPTAVRCAALPLATQLQADPNRRAD